MLNKGSLLRAFTRGHPECEQKALNKGSLLRAFTPVVFCERLRGIIPSASKRRYLSVIAGFAVSAIVLFAGCTKPSDLEMVYNPWKGFSTGFWQVALLVEADTNFSSLLYDKTEAKFNSFNFHTFQQLPMDSVYFILPAAYTDHYGKKWYDKTYSRLLASYLRMNGFGKVTEVLEDADYIIMADVRESDTSLFGTNTSHISLTISDPDESPVFYAQAGIQSSSDANFYYRPSKYAKGVKYLTLKGFERIFKEALPQAFS